MSASGTGAAARLSMAPSIRKSELDDLVETAWGDLSLDLHRGHAPIESVLETLTASFVPLIEQRVDNGMITGDEVATWTGRVRTAFRKRVYWEG